jgi:transmembrane sensor
MVIHSTRRKIGNALAPEDQSVWDKLEGLRDSDLVAQSRDYAYRPAAERSRRGTGWSFARPASFSRMIAATCAVLGVAAVILCSLPDSVRTGVGETRKFTLSDGSAVTLSTATEIRFTITGYERRVSLVKGEARFDVSHDKSRPFRVSAGPMMVTALGTAFEVAALPKRTTVTLIEGEVVVESRIRDRNAIATRLVPGDELVVAADGYLKSSRPAGLDMTTGPWGLIEIHNLTLADALTEINRSSEKKVIVRTQSLQGRRISGVFHTGNVQALSNALQALFDLQVVAQTPNEAVLDRSD